MTETVAVPLTLVSLEVGIPAETLARQHAADVVIDDLDRACLPRPLAARLIRDHHAAQARTAQARAERHARTAAQHRQASEDTRARVRAAPVATDPNMSALETMMGGEAAARLDALGQKMQRLRRGESWGARFTVPAQEGD